eukprot:Awhi_evm1s14344
MLILKLFKGNAFNYKNGTTCEAQLCTENIAYSPSSNQLSMYADALLTLNGSFVSDVIDWTQNLFEYCYEIPNENYPTLELAKAACLDLGIVCTGVYDSSCDNLGSFTLCKPDGMYNTSLNACTYSFEESLEEPNCEDGFLNQGELDVDYGGPCPSCGDGLQNQDETGVDCGGVCTACLTCDDGLQNQNETGVDCGGVCTTCPTCDDGVQNQNESEVDCGGVCDECSTLY